mmetsp:Transcript_26030/g.53279  ORF Transcript_26030/g.53279 Transcript_26030/m.53279 type:complete len:369 (-) Transcript_26030:308-1414(-)
MTTTPSDPNLQSGKPHANDLSSVGWNSRPAHRMHKSLSSRKDSLASLFSPSHATAVSSVEINNLMKPRRMVHRPTAEALGPLEGQHVSSSQFRVYVLLMCPHKRIFELVRLSYDPQLAKIRTLVKMLSHAATEPRLGRDGMYIGLCRPCDDDADALDMDATASGNVTEDSSTVVRDGDANNAIRLPCAAIIRGEILVALPAGCEAGEARRMSAKIFRSQKMKELLQRRDPLAPQLTSPMHVCKRSSDCNASSRDTSRQEERKPKWTGTRKRRRRENVAHSLCSVRKKGLSALPTIIEINEDEEAHQWEDLRKYLNTAATVLCRKPEFNLQGETGRGKSTLSIPRRHTFSRISTVTIVTQSGEFHLRRS